MVKSAANKGTKRQGYDQSTTLAKVLKKRKPYLQAFYFLVLHTRKFLWILYVFLYQVDLDLEAFVAALIAELNNTFTAGFHSTTHQITLYKSHCTL